MEEIEVEIQIDQKMEVKIRLDELIESINDMPIERRWNSIAQVINGIEVNVTELSEEQRDVVYRYLKKKLALFEKL